MTGTLKVLSFDAVTAPAEAGYTVSNPDAAPEVAVTGDTADSTVTFIYGADTHSQVINYVDKSGKIIKTYDVTGTTGATVDTNIQTNVPEGWVITDKTVPGQITFGSNTPAPINVTIEHGTKDVTDDPDQADKVNKTVTRTIDVDVAGKTSEYTTQSVTLHRTATEDLVTKEVTYGPWNTEGAKFDAVTAPAEAGYTVQNPDAAPEVAVTGDTADSTVTFNYDANSQTRKINFVDPDGKTVSTQTLTGKTGTSVTIGNGEGQTPLNIPTGYEIVPNTEVPTKVPFNADSKDNPDITVKVQAKVDTVDGRNDKSNSDVYRQVTRTITVNIEGQEPQVRTQTLDFYRIKSTNEATGKTTYTDWTSNMTDGSTSFAPVEIPSAAGYTRTITGGTITTKDGKDYVASVSGLSDGTPVNNINVTVNYVYSDQTATIKFVNNADHNDVVSTQVVGGKTGQTVPVKLEVPANWQVVGGQEIPSEFTFGSEPIKDTIIYVEHKTEDVTNDPNEKDNVNKTITRTVDVDVAGKTSEYTKQTVTLQRTATKDLVTNKVTYGAWETSKFDAVTAPAEPGYTVTNPDAAPAMDITSDTKSSTVTFIYKANEHSVTITYVDNNGKKVDSYTETGTTGETVDPAIRAHVPNGYHITDSSVPGSITFGSNDPAPITVHVEKNVNPTDADKYTPEPKDIKTQVGKEPTPEQGIGNIPNLPSGTTYTWTNGAPDVTTPGTKSVEITVHYPDGTTDTVTTKVIVEEPTKNPSDADKYTPEPKDIKTQVGKEPSPEQGIGNIPSLPSGTTFTWTNGAPDVTTPGTKSTEITVHYPDGTTDTVTTKVVVEEPTKNPTDADKYTPEPKDIKTQVGVTPNPEDGIGNVPNLPAGTTYTWTNGNPDVSTPGTKSVTITVRYPDGSTDTVTTKVTVEEPAKNPTDADKYTPEPKDITTQVGVVPSAEEGIGNIPNLPTGTTYTWTNGNPDVSTPGTKSVEITVHYPDGSTDTVTTKVTVEEPTKNPTDADKYTPEPKDITTQVGVVPSAEEGIGNIPNLPTGTTYTWTNGNPDVSTPGTKSVEITVHYPDGSTDTVTTKITVEEPASTPKENPTDNPKNNPADTPKETVHTKTPQGTIPNPTQVIKDKVKVPEGAKVTWKEKPDVSTPGTHHGVIQVIYPDGTTKDVDVDILVAPKANATNEPTNSTHKHATKKSESNVGPKGEYRNGFTSRAIAPKANITTAKKSMSSKQGRLPQTGSKDSSLAAVLGIALAGIGSLFGLAGSKKKRKN
ncbi:Rib/alpha-like domain-containing protein [Lactobacillus sp. PV012]|uniref:Rib/alpha-like domain-containing protein n=1 Tax=Lactobacillus sp. PV012 TaxID=2594494 RepID=UPI002240841F|nr:Rib/alpha-like domain-containing protein [Lactobacillus sp. PV012]QNQ82653.1 LPXTG cell wall anchor domain-containing protein [Lactobacillus sp. PV012]